MLPQSEVNRLIGSAKAEAQERARRHAEEDFNRRLNELEAKKAAAQARGEDTREISADTIVQQVTERLREDQRQRDEEHLRRAQEDEMNQVAQTYLSKIEAGKKGYVDFDEVVKDFNPAAFPQLTFLVSHMDNAADVIYELAKNPHKLATVNELARTPGADRMAYSELVKIGKSIEANKVAQSEEAQARTEPPLNRMQPTNKTGSNGQMSISDLRAQPWLRG